MTRLKAAVALAIVVVASPVAAGAAVPAPASGVLPGYWEYQAKVFGLFGAAKERRCLTADKIDDFLFNPCTKHYRCTYPTKVIKDGKVQLDGVWKDKRGREAKVRATGGYSPTTMALKADAKTINGIPVSATFSARRVAEACPAGVPAA